MYQKNVHSIYQKEIEMKKKRKLKSISSNEWNVYTSLSTEKHVKKKRKVQINGKSSLFTILSNN